MPNIASLSHNPAKGYGFTNFQPISTDPYFYNVTMLLTGNGINGEQNNTFVDSSSNNFYITRDSNTTQGSFSPYGSLWSNYFNGSTDYFGYGEQPTWAFNTGNFTIEGWFNWSSNTGSQILFSSKGYPSTSNGSFMVRRTSASEIMVDFYVSGGEVPFYFEANTNVSTWYHVALVRNNGVTSLYLNGVSCSGGGSGISGKNVNDLSASGLYIGKDNYNNLINGYISNFRITNNAVYTSSFTPSTTPLTAISGTSLLTCQSNRFIDNSGYSYIAQIYGNPSVQRFSPFNPTASYDTATIGGSGYFDGSGDYLTSENSSAFALGTGNFTLECWVYPTAGLTGGYKYVFNNLSQNGSGNTEWAIAIATATPVFESYNSGYLSSNATINLNTWNHIAVSRSGSTLSMFLNGVRTATTSNSNNFSASNGARIGAYGNGSNYYTGYITNCRVVKGTAVYDPTASTCTIPTAPLTAITNTSLLCNMINAGIPDSAMMNDLETVGNAQVSTSVKKFGTGSISLDGTGDKLIAPYQPWMNFGTGDFTVEMWINFNTALGSLNEHSGIYVYRSAGAEATSCNIRTRTAPGIGVQLGNTDSTFNWDPSPGTWYHLAIVRSSGTLTMYVNGISNSSATNTGNVAYESGYFLTVGGNPSVSTLNINAYIDDLRVSKFARYTSNFDAPTSPFPTY